MRLPRKSESSRRSPRPGSSQREISAASSGRCLSSHFSRRVKVGQPLEQVGLERFDGKERDQADHRPHAQRDGAAIAGDQLVVVELILLVPERRSVFAHVVHRVGDAQEMLEELAGDVLVDRVVDRELECDAQEVQAVHRHPGGGVGLVEMAAAGKRFAAIEDADVVQAQKTAAGRCCARARPCDSPTR